MNNILPALNPPALVSLLITVPFILLELVNRRAFDEVFSHPLFVMLWLLPAVFLSILIPTLRTLWMEHKFKLLVRFVLLLIPAVLWIAVINDQMPCFLGIPNCD